MYIDLHLNIAQALRVQTALGFYAEHERNLGCDGPALSTFLTLAEVDEQVNRRWPCVLETDDKA